MLEALKCTRQSSEQLGRWGHDATKYPSASCSKPNEHANDTSSRAWHRAQSVRGGDPTAMPCARYPFKYGAAAAAGRARRFVVVMTSGSTGSPAIVPILWPPSVGDVWPGGFEMHKLPVRHGGIPQPVVARVRRP
jgi:hypothetical protein